MKPEYRYIAIEGNIGAGKSTLAKILAERTSSFFLPEQFDENPFLRDFYSDPDRYALSVELSFLEERFRNVKQALAGGQRVIADYLWEKSLVFARINLKGAELQLFERVYQVLAASIPVPDLVIYLHRSSETLHRQINKRGREYDDETIGSDRIAKAIREAREDSSVKAVVLRVNSPGGSALASDVIWREVVLTKEAKPFIVSMGDVAASGGYYISCAADVIVAQPNTITGSIGVFGLIPEAGTMLNETFGITVDTVNTNKNAGIGALYRPVTPLEAEVIQQGVEEVYVTFITRVANGRGMSLADVDSIGQGRVWAGTDALRIGLVDTLGTLDDAIAIAARKAKLGTDYRIRKLPVMKDPFGQFLKGNEEEINRAMTQAFISQQLSIFKEQYFVFRRSQVLLNCKGVQARMPYDVIIE